jgi:hypothetical protein
MIPSDFEGKQDAKPDRFDSPGLAKNSGSDSDILETLEYCESRLTVHKEWVNHYNLQIKKIKKMHRYKKEFQPGPL